MAMPQAIDGKTTLLGLIGERISYTQSPALHNRAAELLARNEIYLPWSMPAADVGEFLRLAWRWGGGGFNVTTPHKELVAGLFPSCGLKSVNTLFRGPNGWQATSTDGEGFAHGLARLGRPLAEFTRVIILGSGGVTTALLAFMAKQIGPKPDICIVRRSASRDAALTAAAQSTLRFAAWTCDALQHALVASDASSLLIQASSAPQLGDDLGFLVPALAGFKGTVCDLVYRKPSALYHAAVAMGLPAQDGGPMLIEQARLSQRLWWGQAASFDDMLAALKAP